MQSSLQDLSRRERRRLIARAVVSTMVTVALLLVLYALAPVPFAPSADASIAARNPAPPAPTITTSYSKV